MTYSPIRAVIEITDFDFNSLSDSLNDSLDFDSIDFDSVDFDSIDFDSSFSHNSWHVSPALFVS